MDNHKKKSILCIQDQENFYFIYTHVHMLWDCAYAMLSAPALNVSVNWTGLLGTGL